MAVAMAAGDHSDVPQYLIIWLNYNVQTAQVTSTIFQRSLPYCVAHDRIRQC